MVDPGGDLPVWNADDSDELVAERMVTTLPTVPGYRIVEVRSVVTELSATPGTSAESKGNAALAAALRGIRATARGTHGANAIVGLSASVFAAHAVGIGAGDAVGVLLTGTAVVVEPDA